MTGRLAAALRPLSPRSRRWRRFLRSLPLDPDRLSRPLASPGRRDFIICGPSRSGTTLLCAALFQPPAAVTVMEPWDGMRMPPAELFASLRREIASTGRLARGRLDVPALRRDGAARRLPEGRASVAIRVGEDYLLGVKWPAYWRFLDLLPDTKFLVCIRHPFQVVASFKRSGGRLAEGLDYDTRFNRAMNGWLLSATRDPAVRRVMLYDYVMSRVIPHLGRPNVLAVRYERWLEDPPALMEEVRAFLGADLHPPALAIREPRSPGLPEDEARLVAARCTTATALGYDLSTAEEAGAKGS